MEGRHNDILMLTFTATPTAKNGGRESELAIGMNGNCNCKVKNGDGDVDGGEYEVLSFRESMLLLCKYAHGNNTTQVRTNINKDVPTILSLA